MEPFENIEKRIKRHLLGKTRSFYVSTIPGFEKLCTAELSEIGISAEDAAVDRGGIEFSGRVHDCYLANLYLRTAGRILMRIESFKATNFTRLADKIAEIPWELYLHADAAVVTHVTSHQSRLIHSGAISEQVNAGIARRRLAAYSGKDQPVNAVQHPQQLFVRAQDDKFTVSIDSSGEMLHKRGLKAAVGKAPIRETIAAAILSFAGYDPEKPLIDPMCGSGTFSLEGTMMANHIPAGWFREFAFMEWPCFKPSRWGHIRREAEKKIIRLEKPVIFASDKNPDACRELESVVQKNNLSGSVSVMQKDFFDFHPSDITVPGNDPQKGLVVINPPYGKRMETEAKSETMFEDICRKLKTDYKGWKFALIAPNKHLIGRVQLKAARHEILHGGLKLVLLTGRI